MRLAVSLLAALWLAGCAQPGAAPQLPSESPYMTGQLTNVDMGRILVEEQPGKDQGNKCWFTVTHSKVLAQQGDSLKAATATDLAENQQVKVWVSGGIRESYPCQASADVVLILSAKP